MKTSEVNPISWRTRLWARLSHPDKWPRCWWFPLSRRRDEVSRIPKAALQDHQTVVQQAHEKFAETVRLTMLSLLGFALFCLLITLGTPDSALLVADPTIKMPFADVQVSFRSFLILAPFLLIVITLYLHIFYGYWLDYETDLQHLTQRRKASGPSLFSLDHPVRCLLTVFIFYWLVPLVLIAMTWMNTMPVEWGIPLLLLTLIVETLYLHITLRREPSKPSEIERLPILFSLDHPVPRLLTVFIFYWLVPLVLIAMTWKGAVHVEWGVPLLLLTSLVTVMLVFKRIRRCPASWRQWNRPRWVIMGLIVGGMAVVTGQVVAQLLQPPPRETVPQWLPQLREMVIAHELLPRPLDIARADLKGKWLAAGNLRGANLWFADLEGANLWHADFRDAKLRFTNLRGANLRRALLQSANLRNARLGNADLGFADLKGADLRGVDLHEVQNLTEEQIQSALTDEDTKFPPNLQTLGPAKPDETAPPRADTPPIK